MKPMTLLVAAASAVLTIYPHAALSQPPSPADPSGVRAERRAEGVEAARNFEPGEGNPIPDAKPKTTRAERAQARKDRRPGGAEAVREFHPGEGDPRPAATARISPDERRAERASKRAEVKAEAKAGKIPDYGDNYGSVNQK